VRPRHQHIPVLISTTVLISATLAGCATDRPLGSVTPAGADGAPAASAVPVPTLAPKVSAAPRSSEPTKTARYVFPVAGKASYAKNMHHDYPAADIMAACGSKVLAVTDGVVLEVAPVDRYDPRTNKGAHRGGLSISIRGDDGVRYYGSHFSSITPGLAAGDRVSAGDVLGRVGRTGDASACHLHFGLSPVCASKGDWWVRRGVIWPATYLDAWRAGKALSPLSGAEKWQKSHGCPNRAPNGA
jgi:peptidoglycan LD-endopeptidase LytH